MPRANKSGRVAAIPTAAGLVGRARDEAQVLVRDVRRVGAQMQKNAQKVITDFERRAEKLASRIEVRAVKAMEPALKRTFATRRELREMRAVVKELAETVGDLARRLE